MGCSAALEGVAALSVVAAIPNPTFAVGFLRVLKHFAYDKICFYQILPGI